MINKKRSFCVVQPAITAQLRYNGHLPTAATISPENSPYIYTHLYAHTHLVQKEEAAKICVLSGLVVQVFFFFLIFYFLFD